MVGFGLTLALMNFSIYQSFSRIPLGVAVTIEFLGPLAVVILGSRRPRDAVWAVLAFTGVLLLARGGGIGVALLGEVLSGRQWAAIGCVMIACVGATRGREEPSA